MKLAPGPFLWSARRDLWIFGGSFALPLLLVLLAELFGVPNRDLPEWAFLAFVVGVDVAHVYATLFRTYLDREELGRHWLRYALVPLLAYAAAAALWAHSPLALFGNKRVGWRCIEHARATDRGGRASSTTPPCMGRRCSRSSCGTSHPSHGALPGSWRVTSSLPAARPRSCPGPGPRGCWRS
jgi:hypothetical protein